MSPFESTLRELPDIANDARAEVAGELAACGSAHADNAAPCLYGGFVLIDTDKAAPRKYALANCAGMTGASQGAVHKCFSGSAIQAIHRFREHSGRVLVTHDRYNPSLAIWFLTSSCFMSSSSPTLS